MLSPGVGIGQPYPLGARPLDGGVNFSVYSRHAHALALLLFEADGRLRQRIPLDPQRQRSWDFWHVFVPGLLPGQLYAWQAEGGSANAADAALALLDPYGRAVWMPPGYRRGDPARAPLSAVADDQAYDWEGDRPLRLPFAQTLIYELHVRGFTRHPSSGVPEPRRGRYAGLIDKIPYLRELGVTAVELMPVFQFDPQDAPNGCNYWGYSPLSFFAPHAGYAIGDSPLAALDEFRDLVKALHRAGLEVILDVVYNHSAEGGADGPTRCLRGLDEATYYMRDEQGRYRDYSGCGNTLNANQAVVRRLIVDSLRYWVQVMHVDGFRFDLAAILSRDEQGHPLPKPPVLWDIASDPALAGAKLIAEAWDAAGLYQLGGFGGAHWKEWNGQFRDDVRDFVRGEPDRVPRLADRLLGSPSLFDGGRREPAQSINFVTSHDGFTLADLVAYNHKHNQANGEHNRDGSNDNRSWNCGVEGPSTDPEIQALRLRQMKNLLAITVLSLGTPMLLMGDEMGRSQGGNNNAYCQDNETSWLDWGLLERNAGLQRFVRGLIRLRNLRESVRLDPHLSLEQLMQRVRVQLHGVRPGQPDLAPHSHSLALTASSLSGDLFMHFALNAWWQALDFELPALPPAMNCGWLRVLDSARDSPEDLQPPELASGLLGPSLRVEPRSVVVLFARAGGPHA